MVWVASTATCGVMTVVGDGLSGVRVVHQCSASLCALVRARVPPGASARCALAFAIAVGAGQEVGEAEPVECVDCGVPRSVTPCERWLRSWTGEPLCADCGSVLELDGELAGFAALVPGPPTHGSYRAGEAG